jgi:hypothetical protein
MYQNRVLFTSINKKNQGYVLEQYNVYIKLDSDPQGGAPQEKLALHVENDK